MVSFPFNGLTEIYLTPLFGELMSKKQLKGEYREFRDLLARCIGDRRQKDFAQQSEISEYYLCKMINSPVISRPYRKTLYAFSKSSEGRVSYGELAASCGYSVASTSGSGDIPNVCPCCGQEASLVHIDVLNYVKCKACGLRTADYPESEDAVRNWNRRT